MTSVSNPLSDNHEQQSATADPSFVELDSVSLRYGGSGGVLALDNTSMKVGRGEFVAVVGPSGCGKSTLMKVMGGLWRPSRGRAIVAGQEVTRPLSIVGMAFQNASLLPWRTTIDNLMLPLEIVEPHRSRLRAHRAEYEAKAVELLRLVGLEGFASHYPWQLSGGMQQRASLCRALIHEPALLMLDEPFGALDMFTREELWSVLQEVWMARRPTVILVTHDIREAIFLADKVFVMSARPGRMIAERAIPFRRPRTLDDTFEPEFAAVAHELRDHIGRARAEAA
jgi:NitT/TauT family transport system ATP-binding protein